MTDRTLHGNGEPCPACALRREFRGPGLAPDPIPCNLCGGVGRLALSDAEIVAAAVAWARVHHWPAFDRRNGLIPRAP